MNSTVRTLRTNSQTSALGWSTRITRDRMLSKLQNLEIGCVVIEDADGKHTLGRSGVRGDLIAHVEVLDPAFYLALAESGSIGAAESFVRGEWRSPDLVKVIRLMAANIDLLNRLDDSSSITERVSLFFMHLLNRNSKKGSRKNIQAHYDLGNDFFTQFLDPSMMYSSAVYPHEKATLEEASFFKLDRICKQLELSPDDHLLEIGTGWGGMAEHAAKHYGCRVTTTTISKEQFEFASKRIEQAGLQDRVTLLLKDYRDLTGTYDKLVSIEMIEAVGHRYLPQYLRKCCSLLKEHGLFALQSILIPDQRYDRAKRSVDFIQRYIFPGGFLPSPGRIARISGQQTQLQLLNVQDITMDYARTLEAWRHRFMERLEQISDLGFDEQFHRLWEYYFAYCEGGFRERAISTAQFVFAKPAYRPAGSF